MYKLWYIYTMENYSTTNREAPLIPANAAWQVEKARLNTVRFMIFWRRQNHRAGEQVEGYLRLGVGAFQVMGCSVLSMVVTALYALVKRCRIVHEQKVNLTMCAPTSIHKNEYQKIKIGNHQTW